MQIIEYTIFIFYNINYSINDCKVICTKLLRRVQYNMNNDKYIKYVKCKFFNYFLANQMEIVH